MLESFIRRKLAKKDLLIVTHIICGYPSFEDNMKELEIMAEAGVDLVELQFPFSEPSADGPLFVKANQISLENGTTVKQCFEFMKTVTAKFPFKVLMMGYYNTVFKMGPANYITSLKEAGALGFILPDLPIEESQELHSLAAANMLSLVLLMTPTNTDERLSELGKHASGFVYAVARKGVTGQKTIMDASVGLFIERCKAATDKPIGVGFGISSREDLDYLRGKSELAIIGTAALKAWEKGREESLRQFFRELGLL